MTCGTRNPEFEAAHPDVRAALAPLRAQAWRGILTTEQFVERNRRLAHHPFAKSRLHTYLLRADDGTVLTSMDTLDIRVAVIDADRKLRREPAILIASVITPPEHRGHGWASRLLEAYFQRNPDANSVLFSDIGPPFYERFGFLASLRFAVEKPAVAQSGGTECVAITLQSFTDELAILRQRTLTALGGPAGAVLPDPEYLDWFVERYRYFTELAGRDFPGAIFWRVSHGPARHLVAALPHYLYSRLHVFWRDSSCATCLRFCQGLAAELGLDGIRFWTEQCDAPLEKAECPMIRLPRAGTGFLFHDPQLCDWW